MANPVVVPADFSPGFFSPCFTKKFTVIGIIGHTQGISNATSPPKAEYRRNANKPRSVTLSNAPPPALGGGVAAAESVRATAKYAAT